MIVIVERIDTMDIYVYCTMRKEKRRSQLNYAPTDNFDVNVANENEIERTCIEKKNSK